MTYIVLPADAPRIRSCSNGFISEAVGVFERWDHDAETYFVRKKDGTEVRVPARGVRYGKLIPDPPA